MKTYVIFSTREKSAVDNYSLTVETESLGAASSQIVKACKYEAFTIAPCGAPTNGEAITLERAVEIISTTILHKEVEKRRFIRAENIEVSDLNVSVGKDEYGNPVITMKTVFAARDNELLRAELETTKSLLRRFGNALGFFKTRSTFTLVPHKDDSRSYSYGVVDGYIIRTITEVYKEEVEL